MSGEHLKIYEMPGAGHYRELSDGLRELAGRCRLPLARKELLALAANYERRGRSFLLAFVERSVH
jgi:hypothetical protein